ncbi:MAG: energy transducer TonB [Cellvibrionaceae bacterium]|nr:energy transducer TonB [Cellvibrionaceae bacterium]
MANQQDIGSGDRLTFTVFLAIAIHAIFILGVSFKVESGQKLAPTLNITLATYNSKVAPEKTDFLAQFDQQGSGTESELKELTTQQMADLSDLRIKQVTPLPQQKAVDISAADSQRITTTRSTQVVASLDDPNETTLRKPVEGQDRDIPLDNPEIASLQAKLDKLRQDLARQPKIRRLTSLSTKSSIDAQYQLDWQQKIETIGNDNFPEEALQNSIFGRLRLSVLILPDGRVESIEVLQSSGQSILDDAAVQIVKLAAPFRSFPAEIKKEADKLEIIRTWTFEITGLTTEY